MSFRGLFGNFDHQSDGGAENVEERRRVLKMMANKHQKLQAQIDRRKQTVDAITGELQPLFRTHQQFVRDRRTGDAQRLMPRIKALHARLAKEEFDLRIDEKLAEAGRATQSQTSETDVRSEYLAVLRDATPHINRRTNAIDSDQTDEILGKLGQAHVDAAEEASDLSQALTKNLGLMEGEMGLSLKAESAAAAPEGESIDFMGQLAERFGEPEPAPAASITRVAYGTSSAPAAATSAQLPTYKGETGFATVNLDDRIFPPVPTSKRDQPVAIATGTNRRTRFVTVDDDDV